MPTPSKFTAETRKKVLEALKIGASKQTAAAIAGISQPTLTRWLEQGKTASDGSRWQQFYEQVLQAEAHPRMRALGVIYKELPDSPTLAWKFIERREPGYAPPMPSAPQPTSPLVINLSLSDGTLPALGSGIIEGEVVDESDEPASEDQPEPAPLTSA